MRPKRKGSPKWAAVVFLLMRAPRTRTELVKLLGIQFHTANAIIEALEEEGLAVQDRMRGRAIEWRWVPAS